MLEIAGAAKKFRLNQGTHIFKQVISFNELMTGAARKTRQSAWHYG